ncbi:MAG: redoxin domain-containing protein [Campylobacterota bacterium]|nr:redoxin domain-containing protein [Campylobacterota bacterium]
MTKSEKIKTKLKYYLKEIVLFFIFITIITNIISFYKSTDLNKEPLNMINLTLLDGERYRYPSQKPILLHFWATWCPTCSIEASNIQTISQNYEVITVAVKSKTQEIKKYMTDNQLNFKVVNDESGFIASEFKIAVYPTTFIYNKNKELVFSEVGYSSTIGLWLRMWWANL